jgi:hypothetical protein
MKIAWAQEGRCKGAHGQERLWVGGTAPLGFKRSEPRRGGEYIYIYIYMTV